MRCPAVFVVLAACTTSAPVEVIAVSPLPRGLVAGDIVRDGDVALVVPEPGEAVGIAAREDDGASHDLAIAVALDGSVTLVDSARQEPRAEVVAAVSAACSDGTYNLEGFHWASDLHWAFQAGSTPSANSAANVATGLQVAANAITTQRNDCGFADQVSATNSYAGTTTTAPNIPNSSTSVTCGARDGENVVGFGTLPTSYLGVTCYWYDGNKHALEADIKLNKGHEWFAEAVPAGCSNSYGIEQVGTHEFGHAFGLAHVAQATHASQTMSPVSYSCTNNKVTLGRGDVRGLRALY